MWSWRRSSPAPEGLGRDRVHVRRRATCGPAARRRPCGRGAARGPPAGQACWTPPRRGKVGPAGGFLDRDETLTEGVLRELREETGWTGRVVGLLRVNSRPHRPHETR